MKEENLISGVVPIVPTPFHENEEIDEEALTKLIDFAIDGGIGAVCLPAYASEFYKLTDNERLKVVQIAVNHSKGRVKIVAQSNHPSLKNAITFAKANVDSGADVISVAVPRIFSLTDESIAEYLSGIFKSVPSTPVLVQDFNPGGASISVDMIRKLMNEHGNFRYLKLEEPLGAPKIESIMQATNGRIGLMEGWGGLYMMELIPVGLSGVMPGLAVSDILQRVFRLRMNGDNERAFSLFEKVMPQIFFSLQNMELFHYMEKELLMARGVLKNSIVRSARYIPDASTKKYIKELNDRILQIS